MADVDALVDSLELSDSVRASVLRVAAEYEARIHEARWQRISNIQPDLAILFPQVKTFSDLILEGVEQILNVLKDALLEAVMPPAEVEAKWGIIAEGLVLLAAKWWITLMNGFEFEDDTGAVILGGDCIDTTEWKGGERAWWFPPYRVRMDLYRHELQLKAVAARRYANTFDAEQFARPSNAVNNAAKGQVVSGGRPALAGAQEPSEGGRADRSQARRKVVEPICESKGWSPLQLAREAGVEPATIYDYLDGTTVRMQSQSRLAVAQALGIEVKDLPK